MMCCGSAYIASGLTTTDLCAEFMAYRPAGTSESFQPLAISQCRGDPHITTLDDVTYTFNGHGEFVLIEDTDNSNFTLQVGNKINIRICILLFIPSRWASNNVTLR